MMLRQYLPILIFLGLATVLGLALFTIGGIMGPRRPDAERLSPYGCGFGR
jgi:NADH-quinone oxidoreductase subunit A